MGGLRLYAETNFVLEFVLEQRECEHVDDLVRLANEGPLELVLPSTTLLEAHATVHRRTADRTELLKRIRQELAQLGRSHSLDEEASRLEGMFAKAEQSVVRRFDEVRDRLASVAQWLPIDGECLREARSLEELCSLRLPDALVLASILLDARARPEGAIFVTKNSKDFAAPDVVQRLKDAGCQTVFTFSAARSRIEAALRAPTTP